MKLLVPEPVIPVLRGLAVHVGLNESIVLQQMHFRGQLSSDGWVQRSWAQWRSADFPFWTESGIRKIVERLKAAGMIETRVESVSGGRILACRVLYEALPDLPQRDRPGVSQRGRGSVPSGQFPIEREETEKKEDPQPPTGGSRRQKKILTPEEEHNGFSEWLGYHCEKASRSVPRAGTSARSALARTFAALAEEGYSLEEFKLASDGVVGDGWMVENGWTKPENVLRKEKIAGRVEDGRKLAARPPGKYDHLG